MTYPSNPQEYPPTGAGDQPNYPNYPGAYPPQAPYPQQPGYPPGYAPQAPYPPQPGSAPPGYASPSGYPPQPGYSPQQGSPPPSGYPPQQGYYPPAAYGQPYAPAPMQGASPFPGARVQPKTRNPLATRALIYGALSLGANIVGLFLNFYLTGILAAFTIYYSIRALVYAGKLPGKEGTGAAIAGLILALLSLAITIFGYASNIH